MGNVCTHSFAQRKCWSIQRALNGLQFNNLFKPTASKEALGVCKLISRSWLSATIADEVGSGQSLTNLL